MPKRITIRLSADEPRLTVRALIEMLERILTALRGLDPNLPADWEIVRARLHAPFIFTVENKSANGTVSSRLRSARQFSGRRTAIPTVTDDEIESTKELTDVLKQGIKSVRISSPGDPTVNITPAIAEKVEALAKSRLKGGYHEWTTIRGELNQITVEGGSTEFRITHGLTGAKIPCSFDPTLIDEVKDALPSRVEVSGRTRFNRAKQPVSISVSRIRRLPESGVRISQAPAIQIADGMDSVEYLERVRGGD
ncbi:MAG: hypothetical protein ABSH08_06540 [Tepidisphaeraceae bacterium]